MSTNSRQNGDAAQTGIPVSLSHITAVILAGGQSSRMGTDKAMLEIDGKPLIRHAYDTLTTLFPPPLLITNSPERYRFLNCPTAADLYPGEGSLAGIHAALTHSPTDLVFLVACDMPYLSPEVIRFLCSLSDNHDAVVARSSDGIEPLHALYRRSCLPVMEQMLQQGEKRIRDALGRVNTRYVAWDELSHLPGVHQTFLNLNTPDDFSRITQ